MSVETTMRDGTRHIVADTIDEALDTAQQFIRTRSWPFYAREIRRGLSVGDACLVDRHAGQGTYIKVALRKPA